MSFRWWATDDVGKPLVDKKGWKMDDIVVADREVRI